MVLPSAPVASITYVPLNVVEAVCKSHHPIEPPLYRALMRMHDPLPSKYMLMSNVLVPSVTPVSDARAAKVLSGVYVPVIAIAGVCAETKSL